jgi:hypothetical protein
MLAISRAFTFLFPARTIETPASPLGTPHLRIRRAYYAVSVVDQNARSPPKFRLASAGPLGASFETVVSGDAAVARQAMI